MNYLLLNTANEELVIVLSKDGKIFACNESQVKKHNEVVLPKLQEVLMRANLTLQDIDEFGVVVGPGSFTGLRVGIATIKAFKDVLNRPVRAINNLDLLYQIAQNKDLYNIVAIEGSLNSYFVGQFDGSRLNIYERNLTADELRQIAKSEKVAMYNNSHNFELGEVVQFNNEAFVRAFLNSKSYDLTPIYYQLSQAENDKIARSNLVIREAEVWDVKTIIDLCKNVPSEIDVVKIEQCLLKKSFITYVAQIDEQVVGFVMAQKNELNYWVNVIMVDVNFRNHGIGTKLIKSIEDLAKAINGQVHVSINKDAFTLKTLCEKLNYKTDKNLNINNENLIMVKIF